jgi:hypothetical protein
MGRKPLPDLESCPSAGCVVEFDSEPRLERLDAVLQLASHMHEAFEQTSIDDVREIDVDLDAKVGMVNGHFRPALEPIRA